MNLVKEERRSAAAWWIFVALVAVELALSMAAALGSCGRCNETGPFNAGALGVAGYGTMLALALVGARRAAFWGALIAGGAHLALVPTLLASGTLCILCFTAGTVAVGMIAALLKADESNFSRLSRGLAAGAIAAQLAVVGGWMVQTRAITGAAADAAETASAGRVRIIVYERADCPYCEEFEKEVLPAVLRETPEIDLERRDASDRPELPTPTIVVSGPGGRDVFPGLPTVAMLGESVRRAGGTRPTLAGRKP